VRRFRKGIFGVVTTDIMAQGLDISNIMSLTLKCRMPYTNIGRTGRADKTGTAISFIKRGKKQKEGEVLMNMN
jgi:ATP-dependent RNA helicase RhlE